MDWGQHYIFRFSTAGGVEGQFPVPGLAAFANIVAGPDGNLWLPEASKIGRLSVTGTLTEFPVAGTPYRIAAGPDGNMWVTVSSNTAAGYFIARVSMTGAITQFPLPSTTASALDIGPGPDGNLWFSEAFSSVPVANNICRIRRDGTITEFPVSGFVRAITPGPDGNVWFTEDTASVAHITP